jgi:nicotinic acid mononucleotide adenylyltransferase
MDCAIEMERWYQWDKLIKLVPFIIVHRKNYNCDYVTTGSRCFWFWNPPHVVWDFEFDKDYSSTKARLAIYNNDIEMQHELMHENVIEYIKENKLYANI